MDHGVTPWLALALLLCCGSSPAQTSDALPPGIVGSILGDDDAAPDDASDLGFDDEFGLSLEDLMNTEITAIAGTSEPVQRTPAAVTVITQDDMHRWGHTSVMEALRMVPGMQVAKLTTNTWAISSRGFNSRFSGKLLVLVDGRAVYNDLFSGVYWDEVDLPVDEIQRIEVIRGPGATIWGANAVNGVINIVTREATGDEGTRVLGYYGDEAQSGVELRYGDQINDSIRYRLFGKWFEQESSRLSGGGDAEDGWGQGRYGLRVDADLPKDWDLSFHGQYYDGRSGIPQFQPSLTPPFGQQLFLDEDIYGGHASVALERGETTESLWRIQLFYDYLERENEISDQIRRTFEIDLRHHWTWGERHQLVAGLAYRYRNDDTKPTFGAALIPESKKTDKYSAFIQDNIVFADDWQLMVGTKIEENDYSGTEIQPGVRVSWSPTDRATYWAAASRALRTPARADEDSMVVLAIVPPPFAPVPTPALLLGDPHIDPEELYAFEVGHRALLGEKWSVDLTLFHFRYVDLITIGGPAVSPFDQSFQNGGDAQSFGGDIAMKYDLSDRLRLFGSYSYLHIDGQDFANLEEDSNPQHQAQLRSQWRVLDDLDFNGALYYVDRVSGQDVPSYFRLDLGLIWRPAPQWEVALWGQNLTEDSHLETVDPFLQVAEVEVQRGVYLSVSCEF